MANYYASARSNYFRVKNVSAFTEWANTRNLDWWQEQIAKTPDADDLPPKFAICADENGWPCWDADDLEVDIVNELATHLHDQDVAILMEVGNEKLRFVSGYAIAVNSRCETRRVSLDDIYELAAQLGSNVTDASY